MSKAADLWSLMGSYFWFNLKGSYAFRTSFWLQIVSMIFNDAIWVIFWVLYFAKFPVVKGWHQQDILYLWGLSAVSFGMMDVVFGNTLQLGRIISEGELDIYLTTPKAPLFHALISRQAVVGWGDIGFGLLMLCISVRWDLVHLAETVVALTAATLLLMGFVITAQSMMFFIGGREGLGGLFTEAFLTFSHYPSAIFHGLGIRILIFGIMPAGLVSSMPSAIVDHYHVWILWVSLAVGLWQLWLGRFVFYRGLRMYASGNRITIRT